MSNGTFRRVYDLVKLENWIKALSLYSIPINEILQDKLIRRLEDGDLDENMYKTIVNWKTSKEIYGNDENDCKLFLKHLGVIDERDIEEFEFSLLLGGDGPIMSFIKNPRAKMHFLTKYGESLSSYLESGKDDLYELTLFWLILRCKKYMPLLQETISNPEAYSGDIKDLIPTVDSISRNCLLKWGVYFGFIEQERNEYKLNPKKLAKLFISSTILQLNEIKEREIKIKQLVDILSDNFNFGINTTIDFTRILDVIFNHTSRNVLSGFTTGRDDVGLPSNRNIQILKFKSVLPLNIIKSISDVDTYGILRYFGGLE